MCVVAEVDIYTCVFIYIYIYICIYMCVCVYINKYMGEKMTSHGDAFCTLWVGSLMEDIESHICGGRDIYICVYV